jgi:uncharacterized membrane protein
MSDTVSRGPAGAASSEDRVLAALIYGLLFLTPFFAGVTALIAVVLAYVRRKAADPLSQTHYGFQIKTFWIALIVLIAAIAAAFLGAGVLITHALEVHARNGSGWDAWDVAFGEDSQAHLNIAGLIVLAISALAILADALWLMLASVFGVARLLSNEPIGRLKAA